MTTYTLVAINVLNAAGKGELIALGNLKPNFYCVERMRNEGRHDSGEGA